MSQHPLTLRRVEYERLVGLGVFEGEPVELIDGQLVVAEPRVGRRPAGEHPQWFPAMPVP